jgi:hypothetical protein
MLDTLCISNLGIFYVPRHSIEIPRVPIFPAAGLWSPEIYISPISLYPWESWALMY